MIICLFSFSSVFNGEKWWIVPPLIKGFTYQDMGKKIQIKVKGTIGLENEETKLEEVSKLH